MICIYESHHFFLFQETHNFSEVYQLYESRSSDDDCHHDHQHSWYPLTGGSASEKVSSIDFVVAFDHFEHIGPSICEILELMALNIGLERVFEEDAMIELNIEVDGLVCEVSDTESDNGACVREGWILFGFGIDGAWVLVNGLILDNMKVIFRCLPLGENLISAIFFNAFVEALDLILC